MHPDLSPHLHSKECNEIIEKLQKCHQENKFRKYLGACNEVDASLAKCLKNERESNRRNNRRNDKKVNAPKNTNTEPTP